MDKIPTKTSEASEPSSPSTLMSYSDEEQYLTEMEKSPPPSRPDTPEPGVEQAPFQPTFFNTPLQPQPIGRTNLDPAFLLLLNALQVLVEELRAQNKELRMQNIISLENMRLQEEEKQKELGALQQQAEANRKAEEEDHERFESLRPTLYS